MKALIVVLLSLYAQNLLAKPIVVMIIDTGVSYHKDLIPFLPPKNDTDPNYKDMHGHGTHIAGVVAYGDHSDSPKKTCANLQIISCKN